MSTKIHPIEDCIQLTQAALFIASTQRCYQERYPQPWCYGMPRELGNPMVQPSLQYIAVCLQDTAELKTGEKQPAPANSMRAGKFVQTPWPEFTV